MAMPRHKRSWRAAAAWCWRSGTRGGARLPQRAWLLAAPQVATGAAGSRVAGGARAAAAQASSRAVVRYRRTHPRRSSSQWNLHQSSQRRPEWRLSYWTWPAWPACARLQSGGGPAAARSTCWCATVSGPPAEASSQPLRLRVGAAAELRVVSSASAKRIGGASPGPLPQAHSSFLIVFRSGHHGPSRAHHHCRRL